MYKKMKKKTDDEKDIKNENSAIDLRQMFLNFEHKLPAKKA